MRIAIITPVRNESAYIDTTIKSIISQNLHPVIWIIVDDGSTDKTGDIIRKYVKKYNFIKYSQRNDRGYRKPGAGVIEAFYYGLKKLNCVTYDIIAKMDGDLEFPSNSLHEISDAFKNEQRLGIVGIVRHERRSKRDPYRRVLLPEGFVGGPMKFYRKECFNQIGGLITRAGWDGVDNIKANMQGWETREIDTVRVLHLKPTGTSKGEGLKKACEKYGDVSYFMGGYLWYFFLRVAGRSFIGRNPKIGFYMIKGFLKAKYSKTPKEKENFRKYLKNKQRSDVFKMVKSFYLNKKISRKINNCN